MERCTGDCNGQEARAGGTPTTGAGGVDERTSILGAGAENIRHKREALHFEHNMRDRGQEEAKKDTKHTFAPIWIESTSGSLNVLKHPRTLQHCTYA